MIDGITTDNALGAKVNEIDPRRPSGKDLVGEDVRGERFRHIQHGDHRCRFRWALDTIAFGNTRATQHCSVNDFGGRLIIATNT